MLGMRIPAFNRLCCELFYNKLLGYITKYGAMRWLRCFKRLTACFIVERDGKQVWRGKCDSSPRAKAELIEKHASGVKLVGLESGN